MTAVMVASRAMVRSWNERILPWQRDPRHRVSPRILLLDRDAAVTLAALDPGAEMTDAIAPVIGILGGSGLYQIDGLVDVEWRRVASPFGDALVAAGEAAGIPIRRGGTYIVMEGSQFSSLAESRLYRSWGCDVIGMTNMPEAKLAREAELCYATVAMVTDFDSWHPDHGHVSVDRIIEVLLANADRARSLVKSVVPRLSAPRGPCPAGCDRALEHALITAPEARDPALLAKLDAVAGRVLRK